MQTIGIASTQPQLLALAHFENTNIGYDKRVTKHGATCDAKMQTATTYTYT